MPLCCVGFPWNPQVLVWTSGEGGMVNCVEESVWTGVVNQNKSRWIFLCFIHSNTICKWQTCLDSRRCSTAPARATSPNQHFIADDGKLFHGSGVGDPFGPRCFEGDVMGCGIMFPRDFCADGDKSLHPVFKALLATQTLTFCLRFLFIFRFRWDRRLGLWSLL